LVNEVSKEEVKELTCLVGRSGSAELEGDNTGSWDPVF